ncbi:serine protease [Dactylosporangium sp. NBC_01737]|uniref:S1 family peptidase n=1 Tax=Dactylosporangium sp. NBC_01737 TaxID=2975959 RepID=UPI002E133323|nr:serine protease [Dactylosporangium sp. NBC_01737]
MIDGRIVAGGADLGSGFCLTDRIVATAAHVVRQRRAEDLEFVTAAGVRLAVEAVHADPAIDVATLRVAESLAIVPALTHAVLRADWRVTARPKDHDAQLTGTVTATDHLVVNQGGHEMTVLQLHVAEALRDYRGYSGSAVTVDGAVVGVLVEQVPERAAVADGRRAAANVLYAVPVALVVRRFRLGVAVGRADRALPVHQLLDTAYFDLDRLKTAILDAMAGDGQRVLVFGVDAGEQAVVENLCAWLRLYVGDIDRKHWLDLSAELHSVDTAARAVSRYAAVLGARNVICPVSVRGAPAGDVAELVRRVREAYGRPKRWYMLFLLGVPDGGFPDGVTLLPPPRFAHRDVEQWAKHVIAYKRWPRPLAAAWTSGIVARIGEELDVRYTYEELTDCIDRVRHEPDKLLGELEDPEA